MEKNLPPPPYAEQSPSKVPLLPSLDAPHSSSNAIHPQCNPPIRRTVREEMVEVRMAFVRKVYLLLFLQLFITASISIIFFFTPAIRNYVRINVWPMIVALILLIIFMILCLWKKKQYPLNIICLHGYTLSMSYFIGTIVTFYDAYIVVQAILLTLFVVLSLTLFTIFSKKDFTGWGPFIMTLSSVMLFAMIIQLFIVFVLHYDSPVINIVYSSLMAFIFSLYLIFDTFMIFTQLSVEEHILGVIMLYTDIINLFIAILRILGEANRN